MLVLVLLLGGLVITLWEWLSAVWPLLAAVAVLWLLWRLLAQPLLAAQTQADRDRLRHERARREIDRITAETQRSMYDAALRHGDVIEGTAVEVERL